MTRVVFGKFLELLGMMIVGLGFILGITQAIHLHYELLALATGGAVFSLGYFLEKKYRAS